MIILKLLPSYIIPSKYQLTFPKRKQVIMHEFPTLPFSDTKLSFTLISRKEASLCTRSPFFFPDTPKPPSFHYSYPLCSTTSFHKRFLFIFISFWVPLLTPWSFQAASTFSTHTSFSTNYYLAFVPKISLKLFCHQ